jgi:hypothetical protein
MSVWWWVLIGVGVFLVVAYLVVAFRSSSGYQGSIDFGNRRKFL